MIYINGNQRNSLKCKIKLSFAVSITIAGCIAVNDTKSSAIPAEPPPLVAHILFMILSAALSVSFFLTVNMSKALATIPVDKVICNKYYKHQANALAPEIKFLCILDQQFTWPNDPTYTDKCTCSAQSKLFKCLMFIVLGIYNFAC